MATTTENNFVEDVAAELACGITRAVECWLGEIEKALADHHLTTLGRMHAVQDIIGRYKQLAGKTQLEQRRAALL